MNNYLPKNLEIVAYSLGYTMNSLGKEVGLYHNTMFNKKEDRYFSDETVEKIDRFVAERGPVCWFDGLYAMCKTREVDRLEAVIFEAIPRGDVFPQNIRALRYFLRIDRKELAKESYISPTSISDIESGRRKSPETIRAVYNGFFKIVSQRKNNVEEHRILHDAQYYPILNRIPKGFRQ